MESTVGASSEPIIAPAWGAEVVSSNIVGYEKVSLTDATYKMSGIQFVNVGGANASLNDLFVGNIAYGTEIMFLDPSGAYITYKYLEEAYDEDNDTFVEGWGDGDEYLVSNPLANGSGFWFCPHADGDVTQAGQVSAEGTVTISIPAGAYTMVCNPFPTGFNPNSATWGDNLAYGTMIMTLDASGAYVTYKYLEEAYDEDADTFAPGWGDGDEYLIKTDIADVGEGFWVYAPSATTLTISSPLN